jgi:uncharacterized membrane protein
MLLGYALKWSLGSKGRPRLPKAVSALLALAWLAFLPNTCYLLTEWRHFLFDPAWEKLLDRAHEDSGALMSTAKWSLFFLAYSGIGVLLFAMSVRPVERSVQARGKSWFLLAPPLFFLTSAGVYLGLIVRLNSWDIATRPAVVWTEVVAALARPNVMISVVVFAALLWALYEAVDIWIEGVAQRLKKWDLAG